MAYQMVSLMGMRVLMDNQELVSTKAKDGARVSGNLPIATQIVMKGNQEAIINN